MRDHLVIPDGHAHPDHHNERFSYLSRYIADTNPEVVINIGDGPDMPSMSAYDKGKRSFVGRSYKRDIDAYLDAEDRVWSPLRARKKKLPRRVYCRGNHDQRIERALDLSPELEGTIGLRDLEQEYFYNDVVPYKNGSPGKICIDGVWYAHFFASGVMGRAVGGEHPATSLLAKRFSTSVCGHLHLADWSVRTSNDRKIMGLFCGVFQDYYADWAGDANEQWWRGIVRLKNVENGIFDPEFISLNTLKKVYG